MIKKLNLIISRLNLNLLSLPFRLPLCFKVDESCRSRAQNYHIASGDLSPGFSAIWIFGSNINPTTQDIVVRISLPQ